MVHGGDVGEDVCGEPRGLRIWRIRHGVSAEQRRGGRQPSNCGERAGGGRHAAERAAVAAEANCSDGEVLLLLHGLDPVPCGNRIW